MISVVSDRDLPIDAPQAVAVHDDGDQKRVADKGLRTFVIEVPEEHTGDDEYITSAYFPFPNGAVLKEVRVHCEAATNVTFTIEARDRDTPGTSGTSITASSIVATETAANVTLSNANMVQNAVLVYLGDSQSGSPGKVRIFGCYTVD